MLRFLQTNYVMLGAEHFHGILNIKVSCDIERDNAKLRGPLPRKSKCAIKGLCKLWLVITAAVLLFAPKLAESHAPEECTVQSGGPRPARALRIVALVSKPSILYRASSPSLTDYDRVRHKTTKKLCLGCARRLGLSPACFPELIHTVFGACARVPCLFI
jgi:hypothetical protein